MATFAKHNSQKELCASLVSGYEFFFIQTLTPTVLLLNIIGWWSELYTISMSPKNDDFIVDFVGSACYHASVCKTCDPIIIYQNIYYNDLKTSRLMAGYLRWVSLFEM